MSDGMARRQDRKERAVAEDIDHPLECPIRVLRDLKFLERWPSCKQAISRSLGNHVQKERCLRFMGPDVDRDVLWNVWQSGDMVEMDVAQNDAVQRNSFRCDDGEVG